MADLVTIKTIFDDIKDAITSQGVAVGDCDSPETYASKIRSIPTNNGSDMVTINAFCSSETAPATPTGGGYVDGEIIYPSGWSDGTYLEDNIWMSTGYCTVNGTLWTTPIKLSSESGGDIYVQSNNNMRTFLIFTTQGENDPDPVAPIQGGHWNTATNMLEGTITSNSGRFRWVDTDYDNDREGHSWMAQGTFDATGNLIGTWTAPICITGDDGVNGTDGTSTEFIYQLFTNKETAQQYIDDVSSGRIIIPSDHTHADVVPVPWTDNPSGISEEYKVELICTRKYDKQTEQWTDWVGPIFWATWGEDGTDGDGIEYIFTVTNEGPDYYDPSHPSRYHYPAELEAKFPPTNAEQLDEYMASHPGAPSYQTSEWVPEHWTDDPQDVSPDEPYEWVSTRKYDGPNKTWQYFSEPKLWNRWAKDGSSDSTKPVRVRSWAEALNSRVECGYNSDDNFTDVIEMQGVAVTNTSNKSVISFDSYVCLRTIAELALEDIPNESSSDGNVLQSNSQLPTKETYEAWATNPSNANIKWAKFTNIALLRSNIINVDKEYVNRLVAQKASISDLEAGRVTVGRLETTPDVSNGLNVTIEGSNFIIAGTDSNARITLGMDLNGCPRFEIIDSNGVVVYTLGVDGLQQGGSDIHHYPARWDRFLVPKIDNPRITSWSDFTTMLAGSSAEDLMRIISNLLFSSDPIEFYHYFAAYKIEDGVKTLEDSFALNDDKYVYNTTSTASNNYVNGFYIITNIVANTVTQLENLLNASGAINSQTQSWSAIDPTSLTNYFYGDGTINSSVWVAFDNIPLQPDLIYLTNPIYLINVELIENGQITNSKTNLLVEYNKY